MANGKGHYVRVKRPSGPELYEDASRILDELLQKHMNAPYGAHGRPLRHRTHPVRLKSSGETIDERDELDLNDSGIERCKTMPSRMRGASKDEPLKPKDLEGIERHAKRRLSGRTGSVSSADTEGDSADMSEHRKKKSLLGKAKSRFLHALHRDERAKKLTPREKDSPKSSPKKLKKKAGSKEKDLDKNGVKASPDKGDKRRGTLESKDGSITSQNDGKEKQRNIAGQAFFDTIRKSFSIKRDKRNTSQNDIGDRARNSASSIGSSKSPTPSPDKYTTAQSETSHDGKHPSTTLSVPGSERKESSVSASPSTFPHSSSTESHRTGGDKSSSLYSFASVPKGGNELDNPGDDIPFMDENSFGSREGLQWQTSLVHDGETDNDMHDGGNGSKRAMEATEDGIPFHERTKKEKDELYSKIAQKLVHIGESYAAESGISDSDGHSREPAGQAAAGDASQEDLVKDILACLRDLGDRNSNVIDEHAQQMIEQAKAETYDRFQKTVQHSMGEEVSWNHLALFFYTSKGVMSAVGKGSKLAGDVKEMTLRYFSDRFARWIMDQGGFDSLLSESDSELD
ncbi:mediator of RNA polymerase II transcription subunit 1.1-like isoform X2 [Littorina saxatilis]